MRENYWYIYKITYPNKKIYVGMAWSNTDDDVVAPWQYIGSSKSKALIMDSREWMESHVEEWKIKQKILFKSKTCSIEELRKEEHEWIVKLEAAKPEIGYNQRS